MSGLVKTPSFNLASDSFGNVEHRYLKRSTSLGSDLIRANFILRGGNKTFSDGTKVVFMTFFPPTVKAPRSYQSVLAQWRYLSRLSRKHTENGYLCNLPADPTTWLAFSSLHKPSNDVLDS
ncbi:hypothetical protein AVEN_70903-1 [Araneus ventricosus]|uniref:Uncharacterized protein n=1 Tax=Araneus ventricosus TaxID=182803 RepID=A0A4Y2Q6V6_ARAVE|nr:hypothetical protein AVEN_70903-1 [Araneus ventricosus]